MEILEVRHIAQELAHSVGWWGTSFPLYPCFHMRAASCRDHCRVLCPVCLLQEGKWFVRGNEEKGLSRHDSAAPPSVCRVCIPEEYAPSALLSTVRRGLAGPAPFPSRPDFGNISLVKKNVRQDFDYTQAMSPSIVVSVLNVIFSFPTACLLCLPLKGSCISVTLFSSTQPQNK